MRARVNSLLSTPNMFTYRPTLPHCPTERSLKSRFPQVKIPSLFGLVTDDGIQVVHKQLRFGYTPTEVTYKKILAMFQTKDRFPEIPGLLEWARKFTADAHIQMEVSVEAIQKQVKDGDINGTPCLSHYYTVQPHSPF